MVIHPCANYGKPMSNPQKVMGWTQIHVKNPIKFDLEVKVQGHILIMNVRVTSSHIDIPMCKYGKPMSNKKR